jgi:ubiquinone/menaquinone biosynthesis C-methylase UbiE
LIAGKLTEDMKGAALDIGTGNGILAIRLAQRYPAVQVVGMDYWGTNWEYSKSVCEENARLLKVAERVSFLKGDASSLEFPKDSFDAVVSNLTFHEVKSVLQKRELVMEALRVLKPGGKFAFVDYFYEKKYYGETSGYQIFLWNLELSKMDFRPLGEVLEFQKILRHPRALGKVGIIYGVK